MTEMQHEKPTAAPWAEWDFADRLNKAMRVAGVKSGELAEHLEVHRNAVSNWLAGRNMPRARDIKAIATRTGVPYEWLAHGIVPSNVLPHLDSNQEPSDYSPDTAITPADLAVLSPDATGAPSVDEILTLRKALRDQGNLLGEIDKRYK